MMWEPSLGNEDPKRLLNFFFLMLDLLKTRKLWKGIIGQKA